MERKQKAPSILNFTLTNHSAAELQQSLNALLLKLTENVFIGPSIPFQSIRIQ